MSGKNIVLGITGSIAAYKGVFLARLLVKDGVNVKIVMTKSATKLITPLTFQAITGHNVYSDVLKPVEDAMEHIELARWADLIVIAPATASSIAKLAAGMGDDMLSTLCLAKTSKVMIAPAMNKMMWENSIVNHNIEFLKKHEYSFVDPEEGQQACGDEGLGRMAEPEKIFEIVKKS